VIFNGAQAESRVLSHGDELVIGQAVVRFAVSAPEADEPTEGSLTNMTVVGAWPRASTALGSSCYRRREGRKIPLGNTRSSSARVRTAPP
jgi:hypothetical protein